MDGANRYEQSLFILKTLESKFRNFLCDWSLYELALTKPPSCTTTLSLETQLNTFSVNDIQIRV